MTIPAPLRPGNRSATLAQSIAACAGSLLLVALSTAIGLVVTAKWGSAPVDMLYLPPVLFAAAYAGLGPALVAAVASTLAFNYFFTVPYRTLFVDSPADIVTITMLFVVAVVCSQLAASVRRQAQLAADHASRNATIAGFARRLLSTRAEEEVATGAAQQLAHLFDCHVVVLAGTDEVRCLASAPGGTSLGPDDLAAAMFTLQSGERSGRGHKRASQADWQFHPVAAGQSVLAAVGLARGDGSLPMPEARQVLLESLLDQMALALERARLESDARASSGLRMRDRLRSALLTSIGDDIKPPLQTVKEGLRTLRREGAADRRTVTELDSQVARIERHIDNLVDIGPGETADPIPLGDVTIDLHRRVVSRGGVPVHLTPREFGVLAELAKHAGKVLTHTQILRSVWGPAQQDHVDYLRVAVRTLRQKVEADPASPQLIVNEPGVGYRLVVR